MDRSDILPAFLIGLQIIGLLLLVPTGILMYRNSIRDAEFRRDAGMNDQPPTGGRGTVRLLRIRDTEGLRPRELLSLQLLARTLLSRRPLVMVYAGFPLTQLSWLFLADHWWMRAFSLFLAVFYLSTAVRIERNARLGAAFLRQHPLPGQERAGR
ncbi:hypothetical protein KIH74_21665 [Kineosporia sp. J2-2]|uniref:Uncharacterized protein n=1 Tax=Kineosporia corallincola TaxID=2835133 RepID=A0ABS5TKF1_9ACTN|nr:hypothetical protein [Kineosporia corallincola]MBT0771561.1 hypothetical protein [Kineosporia corallincola]